MKFEFFGFEIIVWDCFFFWFFYCLCDDCVILCVIDCVFVCGVVLLWCCVMYCVCWC